jgi:glycine/D-amino acid oxidase-like deaminating enzyme
VRVTVVGAGIAGLSVARGLLKLGHAPVVLEQGTAPNPLASSADRHRLIRYAYGLEHGYAVMVGEAYAAWEALWADLGERLYVETGQLLVGPHDDPWVRGSCRSLELLGLPFELLDAGAVAARYPVLDPDRAGQVLHSPTGGALLAERIVAALAAWLRRQPGAELRQHARVTEFDPERATVRLADGAELGADALVVCAGPWLPRLVPAMTARVTPSRQVLAYVRPPAELAPHWRGAPMITDVLTSEQSIFYAVPPVADAGLKFGDHRFTRGGDPDADRAPLPGEVAEVMGLASRRLRRAEDYAVEETRTCFYTVTDDERFVAHREGRLLALSPCSGHGFKFGPLVGERVAEVVAGARVLGKFARWLAGREGA